MGIRVRGGWCLNDRLNRTRLLLVLPLLLPRKRRVFFRLSKMYLHPLYNTSQIIHLTAAFHITRIHFLDLPRLGVNQELNRLQLLPETTCYHIIGKRTRKSTLKRNYAHFYHSSLTGGVNKSEYKRILTSPACGGEAWRKEKKRLCMGPTIHIQLNRIHQSIDVMIGKIST